LRRRAGAFLGFNWQIVLPVIGGAVLAAGLGMAACLGVALYYADGAVAAFAVGAGVSVPLGTLGVVAGRRMGIGPLRARDTFFAVTLAWVLAAAAGTIPLLVEGTFRSFAEAFFEAMSGFTTTGATLLEAIEEQPHAVLLWRGMMQWFGGIGIVVLFVAVAPATGLASQRVFYAETSGPTTERLTPRIADTAKILWIIYLGLTALGFLAFMVAGMSPFEAISHIFTTIATGGFSPKDDSIAAFDSLVVELVVIVFMVAGGINFALYWKLIRGGSLWPQLAEVRAYLLILAGATALMAGGLVIAEDVGSIGEGLRSGAFQVVSIMTSTGYTTVDFDAWNDFARVGLLLLMFVGGCAGSTAGGMKVIRVMLLAKTALQEIRRELRPAAVNVLRLPGRVFPEAVRHAVLGFFLLYLLVFGIATLLVAATGLDVVSAASSAAATLNVVGPAFGTVGPTESYAAVTTPGLWVLSACMLLGRLEIFTVLVLFTRAFWQR
jgi:trk system potassium uptake protein